MRVLKNYIRRNVFPAIFRGNKPDFMIVGAQKSGTTSLFSYLDEIPGIVGSQPKEVHFFDREDNYSKGLDWYERHFVSPFQKDVLHFEASPTYLYREKVPERLKRYNPDLKVIILLREPVSRAYSAWNMYRQWSVQGFIPHRMQKDLDAGYIPALFKMFYEDDCPSFSEYIRSEMDLIKSGDVEEEPSLLRRGIYKPQIERYFSVFGRSNVLVLGFNELKNNSDDVLRKCQKFLGVSYRETGGFKAGEIKNKRSYPSKISEEDAETLKQFYAKPNEELFDILGFRPDW